MDQVPLNVETVSKCYGRQQVLDSVSLALRPGEIFGLIGLNGVGKTTLIKILLGLTRADSGKAWLYGVDHSDDSARKSLAYLPEKFQPSRYLKGMEYLRLTLSYYGKTLDETVAREHAAALGLDPGKLTARVSTYSKGMGQKLGLLGAILSDTPLLILDEPMSGLDPLARIQLKNMLKAQRDAGRTVFFSSHILGDIDEICDRMAVIHGARITFTGTPQEFKKTHTGNTLEETFLDALRRADASLAA